LKPLASPLTAVAMLDKTKSEKVKKNACYNARALTNMKLEFAIVTSICAYLTVDGLICVASLMKRLLHLILFNLKPVVTVFIIRRG
jgi:hypothetical protein